MTRYAFCMLCLCAALMSHAALFAQTVSKPKITNIPGGYFIEWASPVELAAVQLDKSLSGKLQVMFDVPDTKFISEVLDKNTPVARAHEMTTVLADYWIVRGNPRRAIPLYENALKQGGLDDKRALVFHNNLAMLYARVLKEYDKAQQVVDSALETRKDDFVLLDTKGLIFLDSGDPEASIPPLQRAVELSCQNPIYCMHLAYALHKAGRTATQARRYFDLARDQLIDLAPNMGKENKEMYDELQRVLPPVTSPQ